MLSRISRSATAKSLTINMEDSFNRLAYAVDFERFAVSLGLHLAAFYATSSA